MLGNQTKEREMCVPWFPSKLRNAILTASAVTVAVTAPQSRPAPENKSCNTKHESALMEESSFQ